MADSPPSPAARRAHRLDSARSSYLRMAREQRIDWHPWGTEPFETARRTGRPVLLDIGAAWCHWCHVMDEGTYADPEVERLIAQHFVAVKVDRDELPEVDRRIQRQVSVLTGQGGWPLTAFLTPAGEVFLGGTYFPPDDGLGRPGFRRVLKEVARLYRDEPDRIQETSKQIREALERMHGRHGGRPPTAQFVQSVVEQVDRAYDAVNGGFGFAPKFPHPTAVSLLLWRSFATNDPGPETRALETLRRMADGGVYDQVGGGFHRYSVDEGWHVPHFEKMASDNAALLSAYVEGARRSPEERFDRTIRGILGWTESVLGDPAGGFAASQDADTAPGDDGGYFTWSRPELKAVLEPEEVRIVTRVFGVGSDGRMPHDPDRNVLFRLMDPAEAAGTDAGTAVGRLEGAVAKLKRARDGRPTPGVDRALYADLNGGFIRALVAASRYLGEPRGTALARRAADRFLDGAYDPSRGVAHRLDADGGSGFGHLEDQAHFALGLLELAGATLEARYVKAAERLLTLVDAEYRGEDGLLRDLSARLYDGPDLGGVGEPTYPLEDNPHLSANAAAALAFLRLASLTEAPHWRTKAEALVTAAIPRLEGAGLFGAGTALAAGLLTTPPARVVVTGAGPGAEALARAAERTYHPNLWVFRGPPPAPFSLPEEVAGALQGGREPRALLCLGPRCLPPITDAARLPELVRAEGRAPG